MINIVGEIRTAYAHITSFQVLYYSVRMEHNRYTHIIAFTHAHCIHIAYIAHSVSIRAHNWHWFPARYYDSIVFKPLWLVEPHDTNTTANAIRWALLYNMCRYNVYICRWLWIYRDIAGLHYATIWTIHQNSVEWVTNNHWGGSNNRNHITNMTIIARKM